MKLKEVRLNQHQTHMEDLVLLGEEGINEFNDKINRFKRSLEGEDSGLNTTTKIDGAPAVVVWHTFEGLPDNSICLKSFMTPNPKVLSSIEDIENTYGDRPAMATMLAYCLELSRYIPDGQAWQGDCLFINRTLKEREINDTSYLTFQPNKIIYAFSENNPGYEEVKNAEFGIAFHTIYTGNKEHKSQSFRVNAKELNAPSKFYILSPALNASSSKENYNLAELDNLQSKFTAQSEALLSDNSYNELINNKEFMGYWNTFENANLADKQATNINVNTFINDLKEYIDNKLEKEYNKKLGTLKTDKGRERALLNRNDSISRLNSIVENNKQTLVNLVNCLNTASDIKMLLWEGFKKTKTDYSTFYQSKTRGYLNADPEGIAMSDSDGNIVKIVDRSTFSSHNRDDDYTSGFDHQNEELECFNIYNEELQEVEPSWSKFESLLEGIKKIAVVGFGRMNPPTIGHEKLINKIHEIASSNGGKPLFYLSHTQDKKKNPLSYEDKLNWCRKAFGDKVELPNSSAKTMIDVLKELDSDGYTDIVYVGGGDRIGGAEDVTQMLLRYNGQPTKAGEIIYDFNSIDFVNAGDRSDDSDDITSRASASLAREYVKNNDFDNFSKIVPFNEEDAKELFDDVKIGLGITELNDELEEKLLNEIISSLGEENENDSKVDLLSKLKSIIFKLKEQYKNSELYNTITAIENLTTLLDINSINKLNKKLTSCDSGLKAIQFINVLKPTSDDLKILLNTNLKIKDNVNLSSLGFSKDFIYNVIRYKPISKSSTSAVGPYEFSIALLFENGSMKVAGGTAGDVSVDGQNIEVKSFDNGSNAQIGTDGKNVPLVNAFNNYIFDNIESDMGITSSPAISSRSYNIEIEKENLPNILKNIVGDTGKISFEEFFNSVFRQVVTNYIIDTNFDYLAACKNYNIYIIPSEDLANRLLNKNEFSVRFTKAFGRRQFHINKLVSKN